MTTEKYMDVSEADDTDVNLDLNIGLNLDEDYFIGSRDTVQITFDADLNAGNRVDNETGRLEDSSSARAGISAGKTVDNIFGDVDLGYKISKTDFDTLDGYLRHEVVGKVASILDPETALTFTSTWTYDDSDNNTNDGATWDNQVGIRKILTEKTQVAASVGYATSEIGNAETLSYNINGTWIATDKTKINLIGGSSISPSNSQDDTASVQNDIELQLLLAHSDTLTSRFSANLTKIGLESGSNNQQDTAIEEDAGDPGLRFATSSDSDTVTLEYDLVYGPRDLNYNLFWETEYQVRQENSSNNEYDNFITAVGILLHY